MKKEENSNIIKSILKLLLYIFIILFIYILIMINKELKITKIIFNILKISSPLFFGILIAYLLDPIVVKLEKKNIKVETMWLYFLSEDLWLQKQRTTKCEMPK